MKARVARKVAINLALWRGRFDRRRARVKDRGNGIRTLSIYRRHTINESMRVNRRRIRRELVRRYGDDRAAVVRLIDLMSRFRGRTVRPHHSEQPTNQKRENASTRED